MTEQTRVFWKRKGGEEAGVKYLVVFFHSLKSGGHNLSPTFPATINDRVRFTATISVEISRSEACVCREPAKRSHTLLIFHADLAQIGIFTVAMPYKITYFNARG